MRVSWVRMIGDFALEERSYWILTVVISTGISVGCMILRLAGSDMRYAWFCGV